MQPVTRILQVTAATCFLLGFLALAGAMGVFNGFGQQLVRVSCPELTTLLDDVEHSRQRVAVQALADETCANVDAGTVTLEEFVVFEAELDLAVADQTVTQAELLSLERVYEALREP